MSKAAKFDEFLSSNNINCFSKEEIDNEMHSIVYRAHMEVSSQNLPTMIVLDDSIYTMIQVRVAAGVVNAGNREGVLMHINELNKKYKVFKYYEGDNGDICLDSCITTTDEGFEAPVIHTVIDVILKHLVEEYAVLMRKVCGN